MDKSILYLFVVYTLAAMEGPEKRIVAALTECRKGNKQFKEYQALCGGLRFFKAPVYCETLFSCLYANMHGK